MVSPRTPARPSPLTALGVTTLAVALLASALTGPAASAAARLPVETQAATASSCGTLFDDFAYTSSSDPRLAARGWTVRSGAGGPGVEGNTWSAAGVDFPGTGASQSLRLTSSTDGTPAGTVNAEVSQDRKFFEGTYAARVRFTDAPVSGADGDPIVETFFTITPLDFPNDPQYGEADFEYLANGGWGETSPTMFTTTYETYQPVPWKADKVSTLRRGSLDGWHDLTLQVDSGVVRYFIDGVQVAEHGGHVYPETPMLLSMNLWFIDLASHTGGVSRYEQEVDYVYYADREVVAPADVSARVSAYRSAGTVHTDSVTAGTCTPTSAPSAPTPAPSAPTAVPVPTGSASPSPGSAPVPTAGAPAAVSCDGLLAWSGRRWYWPGTSVTHDRHAWRATRFTRRAEPGTSPRWDDLGECSTRP